MEGESVRFRQVRVQRRREDGIRGHTGRSRTLLDEPLLGRGPTLIGRSQPDVAALSFQLPSRMVVTEDGDQFEIEWP